MHEQPALMSMIAMFVSPAGTLTPPRFWVAILVVYGLFLLSQFIPAQPLPSVTRYWPFAIVQMVLTWSWFVLHRKRLRDAGRATSAEAIIAVAYALAITVLLIIAGQVTEQVFGAVPDTLPSPGAALLIAVLYWIGVTSAAGGAGALAMIMAGLAVIATMPAMIAVGFSIWAGTRPRGI